MSRQDQHLTTVNVGGRPLGVFDTVSGGEADSEETKHRPGGMGPQRSYGGPQTVSNVTVTRVYELERDHDLARSLVPLRGKAQATVTKQPLDADGNPYGAPIVYRGRFKRLKFPDGDSDSTGVGFLELEISTEGTIA